MLEDISRMNKKPAVFFDRDGVLNHDIGYLYRKEDFEWIDGAIQAIKYFNEHGYWVFVITNQSGVARDYYSESDVQNLHEWMNNELKRHGAHIDAFYYCPHHVVGDNEKYRLDCECRKPKPGLIQRAIQEWPVQMNGSFMVGDKQSDIECAESANIAGIQFLSGNLYDMLRNVGRINSADC
jgi:D-glycero-D-manno-heptose 1,7-bisphosphate phosphatase